MDGASARRGEDYVIYRDRGSLSVNATKCKKFLDSKDTMGVLRILSQKKRLPLVLCTDNGSPFCSNRVKDFLNKNYIVHLKNLPHTPEHNGSCENAVREFKELFLHKSDVQKVVKTLNKCRKRKQLNWQTSHEFEQKNFTTRSNEERKYFYLKTKQRIKNATIGINNAYRKRKIEREEILKTMQDFSLITITRGNQLGQSKAEEIT